jgi:hypothetical protein
MSSGNPIAFRRLPAIRAVNGSPEQVSIGSPTQSASLAVAPALNGDVSKNKSAILYRAK